MRPLGPAIALCALASAAAAQTVEAPTIVTHRVTFEVVSPALPDSAAVFVAGSHPALGGWAPDRVRLSSRGGHLWRVTIKVASGSSLEYKYTLGSWEREAADSAGRAGANLVARITSDTTLRTTVPRWRTGARERKLDGQVTGTLRVHRMPEREGVPARDLTVWLPPGYDASPARRYPVLYMFDGQNVFDPATSSFGTDWAADEAADSLIRAGAIEPLIIVGMASTAQRNAEYLPGPRATAHMQQVIDEFKPFIDATYRTRPGRESTWIGGSSAGGIAAFMYVWERPDVFSRALAVSPAFQAPAGSGLALDYVATVRAAAQAPRDVRVYIDIGDVGLEDQLRPGVDRMLEALRAKGYRDEVELRFVPAPGAEHNELAWRRRLPAARVWLLR